MMRRPAHSRPAPARAGTGRPTVGVGDDAQTRPGAWGSGTPDGRGSAGPGGGRPDDRHGSGPGGGSFCRASWTVKQGWSGFASGGCTADTATSLPPAATVRVVASLDAPGAERPSGYWLATLGSGVRAGIEVIVVCPMRGRLISYGSRRNDWRAHLPQFGCYMTNSHVGASRSRIIAVAVR